MGLPFSQCMELEKVVAYSERAWETDYSMYQQQLALCNATTSKAGGGGGGGGGAPRSPTGAAAKDSPSKRQRERQKRNRGGRSRSRARSNDRGREKKCSRSRSRGREKKRSRNPKPVAKPKINETKRKFGDKVVKCLNARPMGKGEISKYCSQFHGKDGCKAKSCKRRHKCDIAIKIDDNKTRRLLKQGG